jgi:uncharacterized protein (TIGR02594 family)
LLVDGVNSPVVLRTLPDGGSPPVMVPGGDKVRLNLDDVLLSVADSANADWVQVEVDNGGGRGFKGFIKRTFLAKRDIKGKAIAQNEFARFCAVAGVTFNVDVAYLLAVARMESGGFWNDAQGIIPETVYDGGGATGPFQFMPKTWTDLAKQIGDTFFIRLIDILDPSSQATFAGFLANDGISRHEGKFGGLPSPSELYLYHFFGTPAALAVLGGKGSDRVDALLLALYGNQAKVDQILTQNKNLLTTGGIARSRDGLIDEVAGRLHGAYAANATLIANAAAWWPLNKTGLSTATGPTPWLTTAQGKIGVAEAPGPANNPEISNFLSTVGFGAGQPDSTAWCAAFVCWCLLNCGDATAEATAKKYRSSFAKDWLKLPNDLLEAAVGAIGILKKQTADTTGHVGFISAVNGTNITLLAGNQHVPGANLPDQVCERAWDRAEFVGFRWVGVEKPPAQ